MWALVCVGLQRDFVDPASRNYCSLAAERRLICEQVLAGARRAAIPVLHARLPNTLGARHAGDASLAGLEPRAHEPILRLAPVRGSTDQGLPDPANLSSTLLALGASAYGIIGFARSSDLASLVLTTAGGPVRGVLLGGALASPAVSGGHSVSGITAALETLAASWGLLKDARAFLSDLGASVHAAAR
jgi:hypothetical protein